MKLCIIAHNLRSCYNVGSLLRTCDGLGAEVILTGTTPYPHSHDDTRLPHVARRAHSQIAKTALGAETSVDWRQFATLHQAVADVRQLGFSIAALEQADNSQALPTATEKDWAIIIGNEANGIDPDELSLAEETWEIPMRGQKQSFNVIVAATIALWQLNQI